MPIASASAEALPLAEPPVRHDQPLELERLYREHHDFVWKNARRMGCDDASLDDVVHEVFLVVARKYEGFLGRSEIRTWLFAITYRVLKRLQRDRARRGRHLVDVDLDHELDSRSGQPARQDAAAQLRQLLARLSEARRLVFILAELEGMTSLEIGRCLGMKTGTVDSRLRAARLELQHLLAREQAATRRFFP